MNDLYWITGSIKAANFTFVCNLGSFIFRKLFIDHYEMIRVGRCVDQYQFVYDNSKIESSAVITLSNIVRYCINNYRNRDRISISCWIHKIHPIPRPNGRYGVSFVDFCQKIDRVITAPHCIWPYSKRIPTCIYRLLLLQWNLSITTTSVMKFIACDLFSHVF